MIYRGLKFRPSVRINGSLDIWDKDRKQWFYTALVNDRKILNYYLTEQAGKWRRTMDIALLDLKTLVPAGSLRFSY